MFIILKILWYYTIKINYPLKEIQTTFKKVVSRASDGPLKGILDYTEDQVVSCNFNSDICSSTLYTGAGICPQQPLWQAVFQV